MLLSTRSRYLRLCSGLLLMLLFTGPAAAQDAPLIAPGHPSFDAERLAPFRAEYTQVGFPFFVDFQSTQWNNQPTYSALMIMHGPGGVGIDHVGHYASDFRFAYRDFSFGAYGREHLVIENRNDTLAVSRMPLEGEQPRTMSYSETPLSAPVFDGTLLYWLLAGVSLETSTTFRMNQWLPEQKGITVRPSAVFTVTGQETVMTPEGHAYDCQVVEATGQAGTFVMYVANKAPYLIKQVVHPPGQDPVTVLELQGLR